jgi:hypothetical protein
MKKNNLVIIFLVSFLVQGCEKKEVARSLDWYKTHDKERSEMLKNCSDYSLHTQNCETAIRAEIAKDSEKGGGIDIAPLTLEDLDK